MNAGVDYARARNVHRAQSIVLTTSVLVVTAADVSGTFCVFLHNLTLVLFKVHLHVAIWSTTLSFPFSCTIDSS